MVWIPSKLLGTFTSRNIANMDWEGRDGMKWKKDDSKSTDAGARKGKLVSLEGRELKDIKGIKTKN